jgi:cell division protein FtsL
LARKKIFFHDDSRLFEEVKQLEMEFGDRAYNVAALRAQSRISEPAKFSSPQD